MRVHKKDIYGLLRTVKVDKAKISQETLLTDEPTHVTGKVKILSK